MLNNLNVGVVDDMMTTGALGEVALQLLDSGCRSVSARVLAYTEWGG